MIKRFRNWRYQRRQRELQQWVETLQLAFEALLIDQNAEIGYTWCGRLTIAQILTKGVGELHMIGEELQTIRKLLEQKQ